MADEFDIDKVIPKVDDKIVPKENVKYSEGSFNLSICDEDMESNFAYSHDPTAFMGSKNGFGDIPGMNLNGEDSGLITSDSNFELQGETLSADGNAPDTKNPKQVLNVRKDISKTFKRMLTSNHNRHKKNKTLSSRNNNGNHDQTNESTKYGGS